MTEILKPNDPSWLNTAATAIKEGKVVALAYERLFGLAVNALDPDAVTRVATTKDRNDPKSRARPIAVILPNAASVERMVSRFSSNAKRLADLHWPGPLTLICEAKPELPHQLINENGHIGVRVAGPSPAAALARYVGLPLTATSANLADAPDALSHEEILALPGVDFVVEGKVEGPPGSTIVDVSGERLKVLRRGVLRIREES